MTASLPVETSPHTVPTSHRDEPARAPSTWRTLVTGQPLNTRRNSLNLIRLIAAATVILAHTFYITQNRQGPAPGGESWGSWAVCVFFVISGYLITASRTSRPFGQYMIHRVARIFPAFIVNLIVTAFLFAPFAYWYAHRTLDGFLTTPGTPFNYVYSALTLKIYTYEIAGTLQGIPYPSAWNGSLWTLYFEFLCYLIVGVALLFAWVRRHVLLFTVVGFAVSTGAYAASGTLASYTGGNMDFFYLTKLLPFFMGGAVLAALRKRMTYSLTGAIVAGGAMVAMISLIPTWGGQLSAPLMAYVAIYIGTILPCPQLIRDQDISYGIYIYGFPVQQMLSLVGLFSLSIAGFTALAIVATVPFAIASWVLIEKPAMRRAKGQKAYPRLQRRERARA